MSWGKAQTYRMEVVIPVLMFAQFPAIVQLMAGFSASPNSSLVHQKYGLPTQEVIIKTKFVRTAKNLRQPQYQFLKLILAVYGSLCLFCICSIELKLVQKLNSAFQFCLFLVVYNCPLNSIGEVLLFLLLMRICKFWKHFSYFICTHINELVRL